MSKTDSASDLGVIHMSMSEMTSATEYCFDPASQVVISALPSVHKSHQQVLEAITTTANAVSDATEHGRTSTRNGLTYDQFLAGLMYNEETMLASQYLYFNCVIFQSEGESPPRASMTQGRAYLTNHRLLLLSAELYQGLSLTTISPGKDNKPTGYTVTGKASDILHYQCIPLSRIHSAELNATTGVQASKSIFGQRPFGQRPSCLQGDLSCCGMDSCLKNWDSLSPPRAEVSNERVLTMGVEMPPWGHRYMVQLHLNIGAPLTLVKDYIVGLSRFAPNMISKAQAAAF